MAAKTNSGLRLRDGARVCNGFGVVLLAARLSRPRGVNSRVALRRLAARPEE